MPRIFMLASLSLLVFGALSLPSTARAQQTGPTFEELLAEAERLGTEIQTLEDRRDEIAALIDDRVAKSAALLPNLERAAEGRYRESPNADANVTNILRGAVERLSDADAMEDVVRIAKLLRDNGHAEPELLVAAGMASFAVGDFEAAEKLFARAPAEKLSKLAVHWRGQIPKYMEYWPREQELRAAEAKADDLPRVLLKTSQGSIELELFENEAPNTVANFIKLVESKFYDDLTFHRVLGGFMAQGGCPVGDGTGGPGYAIACECQGNYRRHFRGTISMAHAGKDTGGSQFFITFAPTAHLDGKHTAFGRVIQGMEVLSRLQRINPGQPDDSAKPDRIVSATVVRKRPHEYAPQTLKAPVAPGR